MSKPKLLRECTKLKIRKSLSNNPGKKEMVDSLMALEDSGSDHRESHLKVSGGTNKKTKRPRTPRSKSVAHQRRHTENDGKTNNVENARVHKGKSQSAISISPSRTGMAGDATAEMPRSRTLWDD